MSTDNEKQLAAGASLRYLSDGDIVGLGTGSTASIAIQLLGDQVKAGLKVVGIPTSLRSKHLAESLGIPLTTFDQVQQIDVAIDGADEIDLMLRLIKGGGGALLREKVVASAARQFIVIADSTKQVPVLGSFPLPVEVIPFAQALVKRRIEALGAVVRLRKYAYGNPFTTDEGHYILDCEFGSIADPDSLALALNATPGVVEHGLFINMANVVLIGKGDEIIELRR
jgi:ribose 5-phosphate isomerase A